MNPRFFRGAFAGATNNNYSCTLCLVLSWFLGAPSFALSLVRYAYTVNHGLVRLLSYHSSWNASNLVQVLVSAFFLFHRAAFSMSDFIHRLVCGAVGLDKVLVSAREF